MRYVALVSVLALLFGHSAVDAFVPSAPVASNAFDSSTDIRVSGCGSRLSLSSADQPGDATLVDSDDTRRRFLTTATSAVVLIAQASLPPSALASPKSTSDAVVTDRIYLDLKGIPQPGEEAAYATTKRIVIGLFGEDAPQPVSILKQLVSKAGLPAECKPNEKRTLQREQLEANKVYNSCMESQDRGVTYDLSNVWRIDKNNRIDVGSVSGKFVSRVSPNFEDANSGLTHDAPGVVSVRHGDDGGFGFSIYPGGGNPSILNEDNVVVGRVVEGMDVIGQLNELPVVQSSAVNYMALAGGAKGKTAPSRACRYGGPMYCNELKPLKKIQISDSGLL